MGKAELIEKMKEARFQPITDELFQLYDCYEKLCSSDDNKEDIFKLWFYKGETYFRLGKYAKAQELMNNCIVHQEEHSSKTIMANCNNILGLIYTSMGYEFIAMQNYIQGINFATEEKDNRLKVIIQINLGWMYRDLGDYEKAMEYFSKAIDDIKKYNIEGGLYSLERLALYYIGQLSFLMGNNSIGLSVMNHIQDLEKDEIDRFYEVVSQNMYIRGYYYLKDWENFHKTTARLLENAANEEDFLELSESYFSICDFLIDYSEDISLKLINLLKEHCYKTDLSFLKLKIKEYQLKYAKLYLTDKEYLKECSEYIELNKIFHENDKKYKISNMNTIEMLNEINKERDYYKEQAKYDLMTKLLNKTSFEKKVSKKLLNYRIGNLAIIDIDDFKSINDSYGHLIGDNFIIETAKFMRENFGEKAILGRIGGDEFAVFWYKKEAISTIKKQISSFLKKYGEKSWNINGEKLKGSISMGVCLGFNGEKYKEMFSLADEALYEAKKLGKNQIKYN